MRQLDVQHISVAYQQQTAVDALSFQLERGEIGCLLGPSGCGKTSVLRAIAGFEPIKTGSITLGDKNLSDTYHTVPTQKRKIGMVFQDFALYPHLTVFQNIAFGIAHITKAEQNDRVNTLLSLVNLNDFKDRYPHELSGGQQQRVALIRALAPEPDLLLLDEPFSSMDVTLREKLASELRALLKQTGMTAILVTHDQTEAFAMADSIGVMHQGKLEQWGSANQLYKQPNTRFVAKFIGQSTLINASQHGNQLTTALGNVTASSKVTDSDALMVQIRPEVVALDSNSPIQAVIKSRLYLGAHQLYALRLSNGEEVLSLANNQAIYQEGSTVGISLSSTALPCFGA